jgi:hypothetical protein
MTVSKKADTKVMTKETMLVVLLGFWWAEWMVD